MIDTVKQEYELIFYQKSKQTIKASSLEEAESKMKEIMSIINKMDEEDTNTPSIRIHSITEIIEDDYDEIELIHERNSVA